jgi:hypothetical protein
MKRIFLAWIGIVGPEECAEEDERVQPGVS